MAFQPLVWSAEGRPRPATTRVLACATKQVWRQADCVDGSCFAERWRHEIGIAIQRRKAAMIRMVLPSRDVRREWLLSGRLDR